MTLAGETLNITPRLVLNSMSAELAESFVDNWAYLKAELNWLERVLMLAVARQRRDTKDIDRLSRSNADKATSHWWKGVISLEGTAAYDEFRKTSPTTSAKPYQQQLDARVKLSQDRGVTLALPTLRDRLGLSVFEKNLVLMGIAPEVNRRYARLYRYLQGNDNAHSDLPTVDLVLRLMCRNDEEWRRARSRLVNDSPLVRYGLVEFIAQADDTFLNYSIKLTDELVDYLLAECPTPDTLKAMLSYPAQPVAPSLLTVQTVNTPWDSLVLPEVQRQTLQRWAILSQPILTTDAREEVGQLALMSGASGTGKTMAVQAIATSLSVPLVSVNLATVEVSQYAEVLNELQTTRPAVVLIQSAEHWLRRSSSLSPVLLQKWLAIRKQQPGLTVFSVNQLKSVHGSWRDQMLPAMTFRLPGQGDRLRLWQQSFPTELALDPTIDWEVLANHLPLTGGEIHAIAHTAQRLMAATNSPLLSLDVLLDALEHHGRTPTVSLQRAAPTKRRSTRSKKSS